MENKLSVKESSLSFLLGFIFCQLAVLVFIMIATFVGSFFTKADNIYNFFTENAWGYLVITAVLDLTLFAVFFYFNKGKQNNITSKVSAKKIIFYILISIVTFFALYPIVNCFDFVLRHFNVPQTSLKFEINNKTFIPTFLSLAVFPPIFEELLFRGLIFKGLKQYGKAFSIILTSVCFALFHTSLEQFVYPLLFGMLLSIIMYKENNILYTVAMHITNNFLALMVMYFNIPLAFKHWSYIILSIILLIMYLCFIIWLTVKNNKNSKTKTMGKQKHYLTICFSIMIIVWIIIVATNLK